MSSVPRIIVALDFPAAEPALALLARLDPQQCRIKIGKELFTAAGPDVVRRVVGAGFDVFLDLKFHDIPNTVAQACIAAARLGVWMVNVHALGGAAMLRAARAALQNESKRPKLIAVTVLTSLSSEDLQASGIMLDVSTLVSRLATSAADCGLDGVVCSAREAVILREQRGTDFLLVTPGIRPPGARPDDQQRVVTPLDALRAGADYLVIGRPITAAPDPAHALVELNESISERETK